MFQLGNLQFEVEHATVHGFYCEATFNKRAGSMKEEEDFCWTIHIDMADGDFVYELTEEDLEDLEEDEEFIYESVSPRLYHNNGFHLSISSWKDLEGQVLNWESEYNENGEEAGTLYVFEHEAVTSGKLEFLERHGTVFKVKWSGTANVFWNDEYDEDVPFLFEGNVEFTWIYAGSDVPLTEEELRTAMENYIHMTELTCTSQTEHAITTGISYNWTFAPTN